MRAMGKVAEGMTLSLNQNKVYNAVYMYFQKAFYKHSIENDRGYLEKELGDVISEEDRRNLARNLKTERVYYEELNQLK